MKEVQDKYALFSCYRELLGMVWGAGFLVVLFALISYNCFDNSGFYFASKVVAATNWCGAFGAHLSALLFYLVGSAAFVVLAGIGFVSIRLLFHASFERSWDRYVLLLCIAPVASLLCNLHNIALFHEYAGGLVGMHMARLLLPCIGMLGTKILAYTMSVAALCIFFRVSIAAVLQTAFRVISLVVSCVMRTCLQLLCIMTWGLGRLWGRALQAMRRDAAAEVAVHDVGLPAAPMALNVDHLKERLRSQLPRLARVVISPRLRFCPPKKCLIKHLPNTVFSYNIFDASRAFAPLFFLQPPKPQPAPRVLPPRVVAAEVAIPVEYQLPDTRLFATHQRSKTGQAAREEACRERAKKLEEKLMHFGIKGQVTAIRPGPIITLFEYSPEIDIKISRIIALEDDLALALRALSIRIIAPIPGRSVIGFEIANQVRETVYLSEVVSSKQFTQHEGALPLAIGVDIVGNPIVEDLVSMPHLLVAGSTGSGKSVGLNAMLVSMLCHCTPQELRLILIDPKRLEFAPYQDIPHLLFPIVTSPRRVAPILKWVVTEMERRYEHMSSAGVRGILDYNQAAQEGAWEPLPLMVIMIDELADLMMVAGKEVEMHITRIAQMARAAGIHMIVATQRPSVDVVTGLIKVNFPSRIAYRVSSKIDSKTIIDESGAEKLLGRGDLLLSHIAGGSIMRAHAPYVSDKEINTLCDFLRQQQPVVYIDLQEVLSAGDEHKEDQLADELYEEVIAYLGTVDEISISMLQRKFRIGFNRSARLIEKLEMNGLIAPAQGSKPRKVLRTT